MLPTGLGGGFDGNHRSLAGFRGKFEAAIEQSGLLFHSLQAQIASGGKITYVIRQRESLSVIFHRHPEVAGDEVKSHRSRGGTGVPDDVVQGILGYAEEYDLEFGRQAVLPAFDLQVNLYAAFVVQSFRQPSQSRQ